MFFDVYVLLCCSRFSCRASVQCLSPWRQQNKIKFWSWGFVTRNYDEWKKMYRLACFSKLFIRANLFLDGDALKAVCKLSDHDTVALQAECYSMFQNGVGKRSLSWSVIWVMMSSYWQFKVIFSTVLNNNDATIFQVDGGMSYCL